MSEGEPAADSLAAESVTPLLRGSFGSPYSFEEQCASTQTLLETGLPEGAVAVCDEQVSGRGRMGRAWEAPPGTAILCSVLLRPPAERRAAELSLVGGVATALAVEDALGLSAQIKWPNDVIVNRSKVAGVLAERREGVVVLGIGLNVNQSRDELPRDPQVAAGSLRTVDGVRRPRAPLFAALLGHLEDAYARWIEGGLAALYEDLGPRDFLRNRVVFVDGERGLAIGIDRKGGLEVEIAGERRVVESGEVRFER
jgi:BirA family biotin operon repressor/biotin-[acetyl-CoA-carboxylase] ligase